MQFPIHAFPSITIEVNRYWSQGMGEWLPHTETTDGYLSMSVSELIFLKPILPPFIHHNENKQKADRYAITN